MLTLPSTHSINHALFTVARNASICLPAGARKRSGHSAFRISVCTHSAWPLMTRLFFLWSLSCARISFWVIIRTQEWVDVWICIFFQEWILNNGISQTKRKARKNSNKNLFRWCIWKLYIVRDERNNEHQNRSKQLLRNQIRQQWKKHCASIERCQPSFAPSRHKMPWRLDTA